MMIKDTEKVRRRSNIINFIKIAIQDYRTVAAISPTSRYAAGRIVKEIKERHKFIVEYGAGNGAITKEILRKIPADGRLIAVELNKNFIAELEKINDKRLTIINSDVFEVSKNLTKLGLPRIDAVISGIPFSYINSAKRKEIIRNTYRALADSGVFIVYQHSPLIRSLLESSFKKNVRLYFEPRNFLPYFIMSAEKQVGE